MKIVLLAACLILMTTAGQAQPGRPPAPGAATAQFRRWAAGLPTHGDQVRYRALLDEGETVANRKDFREARRRTNQFWRRLPALFACIRQGSNVLDYPGLLALGPVWHGRNSDSPSSSYSIHVGEALVGTDASTRSRDFVVDFDEKGRITSVDDLVCRQ